MPFSLTLIVAALATDEVIPMKTILLTAAASAALLFSSPAMAQHQGDIFGELLGAVFGTSPQTSEQTLESDWRQGRRPFEQRRASLEARIDSAEQDGSLSRREANELRREYTDIVRLEAQYSANGAMSQQQRSELRQRYRALRQRVGGTGHAYGRGDENEGRWQPLSMRNSDFEQEVDAGLRSRSLTREEALRLRADWQNLARTEAIYQRGGIDAREQADLWNRYNDIDKRLGGGLRGGFGDVYDTARWNRMEDTLAASEQSGRITRTEAAHLRAQLGDLARLDAAYAADRYSSDERSYLTRRYGELDQMLRYGRR